MKIKTLTVKGIGPFLTEVVIPAAELDQLISISGPNGIGKTFLLECVPGALYNYWPFRMYGQSGITPYDFVTPGVPASLEMVFELRDRTFRIIRNYTIEGTWKGGEFRERSKNQTAFIYELDESNVLEPWQPRAEKVKEVNKYVEEEICTRQLFLASVFNSQNSAGDLVSVGKKERKEIFASLIGLDYLQVKSEFFKKRIKQVEKLVEKSRILLEVESARIKDRKVLSEEIVDAKQRLHIEEDRMAMLNEDRETLLEAQAVYQSQLGARQDKIKERDEVEKRRLNIQKKIKKIEGNISLEDSYRKRLSELDELLKESTGLERKIQGGQETLKAVRELEREVSKINEKTGEKGKETVEKTREVEKEIGKYEEEVREEKSSLEAIDRMKKEAAILDTLDCPKNCEYVKNALDCAERLKETDEARIRETITSIHRAVREGQRQIKQLKEEYLNFQGDKEREIADLNKQVKDYDEEIKNLDRLERDRLNLSRKIEGIQKAHLPALLDQIEELKKELPELKKECEDCVVRLKKLVEEINSGVKEINFKESLRKNKNEITEAENTKTTMIKKIEHREQELTASSQAAFKANILQGKIGRYEKLQTCYKGLVEAFDRNGIQALIIDSEKQQFIEIAKTLFNIISGGKIAFQFETQRTLKGGEKREDFELYLIIDGVKRELSQCSQGQQDLGRIVMRATLGIYHAEKSGNLLRTYFLDETTGSLDETNREAYLDFLKYLLNYFTQIWVITHQDLNSVIPCRIEIDEQRILQVQN